MAKTQPSPRLSKACQTTFTLKENPRLSTDVIGYLQARRRKILTLILSASLNSSNRIPAEKVEGTCWFTLDFRNCC